VSLTATLETHPRTVLTQRSVHAHAANCKQTLRTATHTHSTHNTVSIMSCTLFYWCMSHRWQLTHALPLVAQLTHALPLVAQLTHALPSTSTHRCKYGTVCMRRFAHHGHRHAVCSSAAKLHRAAGPNITNTYCAHIRCADQPSAAALTPWHQHHQPQNRGVQQHG
jgi:hypothetical protein